MGVRDLVRGDGGFTLTETLVSGLTTTIVIALVGGVLYGGGKGFAASGSSYLAAEELAQFGHYIQTDLASTPPASVALSGRPAGPTVFAASLGSGSVGTNLAANTTYYYAVTAISAADGAQTVASSTVSATEPSTPLPVTLSWSGLPNISSYHVYRGDNGSSLHLLGSTTSTSFTDNGESVPGGPQACLALGDGQSGNALNLAWTDPDGTGHTVTYVVAGDSLERTDTVGPDTTATGVVRHLDNTLSGGGVCYRLTPQAGELAASVNLEMALMLGAEHSYQGTVVAYEQPEEGLP